MPPSAQSFHALCAVLGDDRRPQTVAAAFRTNRARPLACTPDLPPWAHAIAAARGGAPDATDANQSDVYRSMLNARSEGSWTGKRDAAKARFFFTVLIPNVLRGLARMNVIIAAMRGLDNPLPLEHQRNTR